MTCARILTCFAVVALMAGLVFTQPPAKEKKGKNKAAAAEPAPATHKVEKKPFKISLTVKGVLAAEETSEISYRPYPLLPPPPSQGPLTIRTIVMACRTNSGCVVK